uniref:Methyl-CpG binding domain protein 3 n=1 Tax=Electrophorus electricus TaxID=8005 RepID=A0A4W4FX99_ELEEL
MIISLKKKKKKKRQTVKRIQIFYSTPPPPPHNCQAGKIKPLWNRLPSFIFSAQSCITVMFSHDIADTVKRKRGKKNHIASFHNIYPTGKKFRSKPQLARYLGNSMDLSSFDFRTGKITRIIEHAGKPDLNTSLPVRQTASIFKQPVTKVTNHPSNKVKTDPQKAVDQPRQLFWEKKLSGLNAYDIAEELVKTMDLPKGLQGVGPGCTDKTLLSAIASALHTSSAPITGQLSAAVEKNPGVWLNTAQPLCKAFIVTDEDIRKQEELVYNVRKRLEEALMADMLAHVEEAASGGEALKDEGNCHDDKDDV